jgi:methionyl-tRNA formyltransferase
MASLRIIFMGTPELARVSLVGLLGMADAKIVGVVTQPDRPKGRELKMQSSPVKEFALQNGLPILQPERARNEEFIQQLRELQPELIAVAAYGQILPRTILELPRFGCLNVHTSLLPQYRGAAPIQWAILKGESKTGVTIMKMDEGMDTGAILTQLETPIQPEDDSARLHDRLAKLGAELLIQTIPDYVAGKISPRPQPAERVSYAPKIKKEDGRIDWSQPAEAIWNRVRGLVPWPGAFTLLRAEPKPQVLKIWQVQLVEGKGNPGEVLQADRNGLVIAAGSGALKVLAVQREGGRRLGTNDFLAGHPLTAGQKFG